MKKFFTVSLCLVLCLYMSALCSLAGFAAQYDNYIIGNPYSGVDWDSWGAYKAALHLHTIASDGSSDIDETVERHYADGFDILAITDHAVLGAPWNAAPKDVPIFRLAKFERTGMKPVTPLTDARRNEIINGVGRGGRGMLEITNGIEMNGAVLSNSHVNSLFADYGQGLLGADGDYETPVREVERRGGITFLDHLGTFTKAADKNDPDISRDPKFVNKFANIFLKYRSCVAMDINSGRNTDTKYDDILWDEILQKTIPNGRNVYGISFSDGHGLEQYDRAFSVMMMPSNTAANLRAAMESGTFFAVARFARVELGEDFEGRGAVPVVKKITVSETEESITLTAENTDKITWISDGEKIAYGASIDLDEYDVGCYVRAILTGPGGICYTQPFTVSVEGEAAQTVDVPGVIDYSFFSRIFIDTLKFFFERVPVLRLVRLGLLGV